VSDDLSRMLQKLETMVAGLTGEVHRVHNRLDLLDDLTDLVRRAV